ncbi:hypothetical protein, partial [Helicobacter pullorum]|uniref:hypothetical protein n=1 Tax=Helicobacter pullorum TaxID=35818 RepID=UPI0009810A6D
MESLEQILKEIKGEMIRSNQLNYQILMSNIIAHTEIDDKDKQILLLLLQDRDRNYVRINHNVECWNNIKRYLELVKPIEMPLEKLVRVGGRRDGGYVM